MKNEEIFDLYAESFKSRLTTQQLSLLSDFNPSFKDAIEAQIGNTDDYDDIAYQGRADTSPQGHIMRRLGHLSVNPSSKTRTDAIIDSYVFQQQEKVARKVINNIPADVDKFIYKLVSLARQQREIDEVDRYLQAHDYAVLYGRRGCGKTFFLNYILSKYSELFDKKKTIFVRVNLVEHHNTKSDLTDLIRLQQAKIICRYYDSNSKEFDTNSEKDPLDVRTFLVDKYLPNKYQNESRRREEEDVIDAFLDVYFDKTLERPNTKKFVPIKYCNQIRKLALQKGYSFIIVLDGLDQLEITAKSIKRHRELMEMAYELTDSLSETREFYLFVCRKSTLMQSNIPFSVGTACQFEVLDPSLKRILDYRMKLLKKEFNNIKRKYRWKLSFNEYEDEIDDFVHYIEDVEICYTEEGNEYCESILESLENYFSHNKRACMQMIQVYYHTFLRERHEKIYLITENIVKCGKGFPPKYYTYSFASGNGKIINRINNEPRKFDNIFINSIFNFPFIAGSYDNCSTDIFYNFLYNIEYYFLGLRILQIVAAYETLLKLSENPGPLYVYELVNILHVLFGYNETIAGLLIEEYSDLQLIILSDKNFSDDSILSCKIRIMPKAKLLLGNYIFQLAYINLAAMRIVLPDSMNDDCPFIIAATLDEEKPSLLRWVISKLINSRSVFEILATVNRKQKNIFNHKKSKLSGKLKRIASQGETLIFDNHGGMFDLEESMKHSLSVQVKAMFPSNRTLPFTKDIEIIYNRFLQYLTKYYE